jgi:LuxR family maltose regulon positive regulatory protein
MVFRKRLIDLLDVDSDRPMTLVSAPTGYGKSMLIAQWTAQSEQPSAWISLDQKDNDLSLFLNYLHAAIEHIFPKSCPNSKLLLQASVMPETNEICRILLNDIGQLQRRFTLVLDDYQLINNTKIHGLIVELMRHPSQKMHLVLISRKDPPLPVIRYLSKNLITIVSIEALKFTTDETSALLAKKIPGRYSEIVIKLLVNKMEGWVTGITLTLLSLIDNQHLEAKQITDGTAYYLQEYLMEEVSKNIQPEAVQYLLECSVLDKFCVDLVKHINIKKNINGDEQKLSATKFMQDLDKSHLFINCLDCENRWCSLHPLFKEFLRNKMAEEWSDEDLADLHISASKWLAENSYIKEAIKHTYLAGGLEKARLIFEENNNATSLAGSKWTEVEKWLATIPVKINNRHPSVLPSAKLSFKTASGIRSELTKRESEILPFIAQGLSNKEIASALYLSTETVKKHLYRIFQKLDTRSRTETTIKAMELGLLPLVV